MKYGFILLIFFLFTGVSFAQISTPETSNGITLEVTRQGQTETSVISPFSQITSTKELLFVVSGHIVNNDFVNNVLNPMHIGKVEVLKGQKAIIAYGDAAKNGVVTITLKKEYRAGFEQIIAGYQF